MKTRGPWYQAPEGDAHRDIATTVKAIRGASRRPALLERLLGRLRSRKYRGIDDDTAGITQAVNAGATFDINVLINLVDTLCAHITTMQPRPVHVPAGARGWSVRRAARLLDKWTLGLFSDLDTYETLERGMRDAIWAGDGFVLCWHDGERVFHERCWPGDVWVDDAALKTDEPRSLYYVRRVPYELAAARWPESKDAIIKSRKVVGRASVAETVEVIEAWHLPSADGADDGRHVLAVEHGTLADGPWTLREFPLVHMRWSKPEVGYYGIGMVEQQQGMQDAFTRNLQKIDASIDINSMRIIAEEDSIAKEKLTNRPGDVLFVKKTAGHWPQVHVQGSVPSDAYQHTWQLYAKMHETVGISELSATAKRPPAEMPGIAYRMQQDIERGRHGLTLREYDRAVVTLARLSVAAQRDLAGDSKPKPEWSTNYLRGGRITEVIPWADMPDEEDYKLSVWPASIMPATPAGQLATAQELVGAGFISKEAALQILQIPDVERLMSMENAYTDYLSYCAERMMFHGERHLPQSYELPYLAIGVLTMGRELFIARTQGAPDDALAMLADWIDAAEARLRAAQQPPPMPPPPMLGPGGPPPALPPGMTGPAASA